MKFCPHCGFDGTDKQVDEHRTTGIHNDEPQAGSNLDHRPAEADLPDVRSLPIEETGIVELGNTPGERVGWECAVCDASTGLPFGNRHEAEADLERHLASEDHAAAAAERAGDAGSR